MIKSKRKVKCHQKTRKIVSKGGRKEILQNFIDNLQNEGNDDIFEGRDNESKDGEEDIYKNVDIENINVNIISMKEIIDESVDNNTNKISNHRSNNNESDEDSDIEVKQ